MGRDGQMLGDNFDGTSVAPEAGKSPEVTDFNNLLETVLSDKSLSKEELSNIMKVLNEAKEAQEKTLKESIAARKELILEALNNGGEGINYSLNSTMLEKLGITREEILATKEKMAEESLPSPESNATMPESNATISASKTAESVEKKEKYTMEQLVEMGLEKIKDVYNHGEFEVDSIFGNRSIDFNDSTALFDKTVFNTFFLENNVQNGITPEALVDALNKARKEKMKNAGAKSEVRKEVKPEPQPQPQQQPKEAKEAEHTFKKVEIGYVKDLNKDIISQLEIKPGYKFTEAVALNVIHYENETDHIELFFKDGIAGRLDPKLGIKDREELIKALNKIVDAKNAEAKPADQSAPTPAEESTEAKPADQTASKEAAEATGGKPAEVEVVPKPAAEGTGTKPVEAKAETSIEAGKEYVVKKGDVLWKIAKEAYEFTDKADIAKACNAIVMANQNIKHLNIDNLPKGGDAVMGDLLWVGDKLVLPKKEELNLVKISAKKKVEPAKTEVKPETTVAKKTEAKANLSEKEIQEKKSLEYIISLSYPSENGTLVMPEESKMDEAFGNKDFSALTAKQMIINIEKFRKEDHYAIAKYMMAKGYEETLFVPAYFQRFDLTEEQRKELNPVKVKQEEPKKEETKKPEPKPEVKPEEAPKEKKVETKEEKPEEKKKMSFGEVVDGISGWFASDDNKKDS